MTTMAKNITILKDLQGLHQTKTEEIYALWSVFVTLAVKRRKHRQQSTKTNKVIWMSTIQLLIIYPKT